MHTLTEVSLYGASKMKKKESEDLKFRMDQLRKDKLILAVESVSFFIAAVIFHYLLALFSIRNLVLPGVVYLLSFAFFIRMLVKNIFRKRHIRKLERKLYGKLIRDLQ